MAAKRKVFGPYRVKPLGDGWEVVEMEDNARPHVWQQLRPRYTSVNRQPAYGKCLRLNERWQEDHQDDQDLLDYWKSATN